MELMKLLEKFDPSNASSLCPASQNEMIKCSASELIAFIVEELKNQKCGAARCMCAVKERFTELSDITGFDADSTITEAIEHVLTLKGLNDLCVGLQ